MKNTKEKNAVGKGQKTIAKDILFQVEWSGKAFLIQHLALSVMKLERT